MLQARPAITNITNLNNFIFTVSVLEGTRELQLQLIMIVTQGHRKAGNMKT